MQHSQTLQAGQSMTRRTHSIYQVANPPSTKPGQSFRSRLPRRSSYHNSIRLRGFEKSSRLRVDASTAKTMNQWQNRLPKLQAVSTLRVLRKKLFRFHGSARIWFGGEDTCSSFLWFVSWLHS